MRRLVPLLVLLAALFGAPAASAGVDLPGPGLPGVDLPNPVGGIGDAILDKICPPREAPYPGAPGQPVVKRGGGAGTYANYGYAGLRWTTWDAGCLSWDKADTSIGTQINTAAAAIDETINEVQMAALDDDTTASFDKVIERAVVGLREAFWTPWSMAGFAVVGLLIASYTLSGRVSNALSTTVSALVVLSCVFLLFARPSLPGDVGNAMTSGVAEGVASSLINATPTGSMPASATPQQKFGEGYYQVSYRAWLEGWSCGDTDAEQRYGARLLDAQAFSVKQFLATRSNPDAAAALVKSKQEAWLKIGEQMEQTNPVAFGCWKGEGNSRTGAGMKHAIVTVSAGFWIVAGSVALLALKWVLRLAVLFAISFGAIVLFSQRMQDRMTEFALLGLLGPPLVAMGVGTLLWGYYAILLDREQSWWMAGVSAFALGMAMWFAKGILSRMFVGVREVGRAGHMGRRGAHKARHALAQTGIGTWNGTSGRSTAGAAAGAALGGAAGAAAGVVIGGGNDDGRRDEEPGSSEGNYPMDAPDARRDEQPSNPYPDSRGRVEGVDPDAWEFDEEPASGGDDAPSYRPEVDAPAQAVARARAMVAQHGGTPVYPDSDDSSRLPNWVDESPGSQFVPSSSFVEQTGPGRFRDAPSVDEVRDIVTGGNDDGARYYGDPEPPRVES